ncbi:MAG: ABC transporter substrate-binding protein [Spirochaetota bacterium]|nr:ABC transporter substrate-binding protein [Spirochaetota bacterium]
MFKKILLFTLITIITIGVGYNLNAEQKTYKVGMLMLYPGKLFNTIFDGYERALRLESLKKRIRVKTFLYNCKGNKNAVPKAIKKFESENFDVIITITTPAVLAIKKAGTKLPVVFIGVTFPVENGIVKSLKNHGSNFTGINMHIDEEKYLKTIKLVYPDIKSIGTIYNKDDFSPVTQIKYWSKACKKHNIKFNYYPLNSKTANELEKQMDEQIIGKYDMFVMLADSKLSRIVKGIGNSARKNKMPTFASVTGAAIENEVLFSLSPNLIKMAKQCVPITIDIITKNKKISDIPLILPKDIEIVINMKISNIIGAKIPIGIIKKASKVIK